MNKPYFYNKVEEIKVISDKDSHVTPYECVKTMIDYLPLSFYNLKEIKVLDSCAGYGNLDYLLYDKKNINLYLNELKNDRFAFLKTSFSKAHLYNVDAFDLIRKFKENNEYFDLIIANPPYAGKGNKNKSISNLFIKESIDLLKDKGYLLFVTPNNWMSFNNNNDTLKKLLNNGSFIVIDNDVKKYFKKIGSSFVVFLWQKNVFDIETKIINNYLIKDTQYVKIPQDIPFIPLYCSSTVLSIINKCVSNQRNNFNYSCELHATTNKKLLSNISQEPFIYPTIHTIKQIKYASIKLSLYEKWLIIVPLSTYFKPFITHHVNVTQSVGYFAFDNEDSAKKFLKILKEPYIKVLIHLTRYGNFNNIKLLKHLIVTSSINFTTKEHELIDNLSKLIKY